MVECTVVVYSSCVDDRGGRVFVMEKRLSPVASRDIVGAIRKDGSGLWTIVTSVARVVRAAAASALKRGSRVAASVAEAVAMLGARRISCGGLACASRAGTFRASGGGGTSL